jgi:uncharacterized protein (DUF2236 family)
MKGAVHIERPGPGSVTWRVQGERLVVLGWPRAILLQLADPLVAAGIDAHSTFRSSLVAPWLRLHATVGAMRRLTFGAPDRAASTAAAIDAIHARVRGTADEAGPFAPAGAPYEARNPARLAWVHLTLVDRLPLAYERLVGPLTPGERDRWCAEARASGALFGLDPLRLPADMASIAAIIERRRAAGELGVTAPARRVAAALLDPPLAWLAGPVSAAARRFTIGTLPGWLREAYGFRWSDADRARLERDAARVRRVRGRTPEVLARWPEARRERSGTL